MVKRYSDSSFHQMNMAVASYHYCSIDDDESKNDHVCGCEWTIVEDLCCHIAVTIVDDVRMIVANHDYCCCCCCCCCVTIVENEIVAKHDCYCVSVTTVDDVTKIVPNHD